MDEAQIAELVDTIKRAPEQRMRLVELLPEQHFVYRDRSTNETIRIRGYLLAAFEQTGLPDAALPFVLQELQSGRDAYLVAGAARALRGLARPTGSVVPLLFRAIENIRDKDDAISFDTYRPRWPMAAYTTALGELLATFAWLGPAAHTAVGDLQALAAREDDFSAASIARIRNAIDCIRAAGGNSAPAHAIPLQLVPAHGEPPGSGAAVPAQLELQDQHGTMVRWDEFFWRAPSIVVFFYTRCTNPHKCSLTISKLARLQQAIERQRLNGRLQTAAITYDPLYDLPPRLQAYGLNRGVRFGPHDRFFRVPDGHERLQHFFGLGVNYNGAIVNHHRVELFVLDRRAALAATFAHLQWDVDAVLECAAQLE